MALSEENLVDCLGSQLELDQERGSFANRYAGLAKIENLTVRLGYLSCFVPAIEEILEFFPTCSFMFSNCGKEILRLGETARRTLESAGVVPYFWASCPERLMPHKVVYVQLLQLIHSKERDIVLSQPLRRRFRVLLMPLTSRFSIPKNSDFWQQWDARCTPNQGGMNARPKYPDHAMLPPRLPIRRPQGGNVLTRPSKRRLWTEDEVSPPVNPPSRHRRRTRDTIRCPPDFSEDDDEENAAPEDGSVPFRQPRAKLRFGICFSGKSSSQHNGGRISNTHLNYKE